MSGDAVSIIADTLHKHYPVFDSGGHINGTVPGKGAWDCFCYEVYNTTLEAVIEHQAEAVVDALGGLEREWGSQMLGDGEITVGSEGTARFCAKQHPMTWAAVSRWVSGWVREPAEEGQP